MSLGFMFGLIGGGVGAVYGGPQGAALGFTIGSSLGGGIDKKNTAYGNADAVRRNSIYNAQVAIDTGEYNMAAISAASDVNAMAALTGGRMSGMVSRAMADVNAYITRAVSDYNADLYEKESRLVWTAAELDIVQFEKQIRVMGGAMRSQYAASGNTLDIPGDASYMADLNLVTEAAFETSIKRFNADIQAGKLLDSAAITRWKGEMTARQIIFEGYSNAMFSEAAGGMRALSIAANAGIERSLEHYESTTRAQNILREGNWDASQFEQAGDKAMFDGIMKGGSLLAQGYGNGTFGSNADPFDLTEDFLPHGYS